MNYESDLKVGSEIENGSGDPGAGRGKVAADAPPPSSPTAPPAPTPSPTAGPGPDLLAEIAGTLRRFVFLSEPAIVAASLFVLHTYAFDFSDLSPTLFITGARRSGKSKLLTLLSRLVSRSFEPASASPAAIYRTIEASEPPTLCFDDVDTLIRNREQFRALLRSSNRDIAFHLGWARGADKQFAIQRQPTWAPKLFSGPGELADTFKDHAIVLPMVRRPADQPRENLLHRTRFEDIRGQALRFAQDHESALQSAKPPLPEGLFDRAADNWTPLLALADLAGGDWPEKARQAAVALSGGDGLDPSGDTGALLADLRQIFFSKHTNRLASRELADELVALAGRPWAEFGKARRPISPNQLADLLRKLGISPRTVRIGDQTPRGYHLSDFDTAFASFGLTTPISKCNTATSPVNTGQNGNYQPAINGASSNSQPQASPDFDRVRCFPNPDGDIEYWIGGNPNDPHAVQIPASDRRSGEALLTELQRRAQLHLTGKSIPSRLEQQQTEAQAQAQNPPASPTNTTDANQPETKTPETPDIEFPLRLPPQPPTTSPPTAVPGPSPSPGPGQTVRRTVRMGSQQKPNVFRLPLPRPQVAFTPPTPRPSPAASPPNATSPTAGPSLPPVRPATVPVLPVTNLAPASPSHYEAAVEQLRRLVNPPSPQAL
jgi:hypothetical protein